jgi:transcriptional regulator with XRE-family HTH domain
MGEVIASFRKYRGWESQEKFAIVCGVDKQTVAYWENQRYLSDMDRRIFLCKVLKITPPTLLGLTWHSLIAENEASTYAASLDQTENLLKENAYGLYEDILIFAHTGPHRYSPSAAYRFTKHQQELEALVAQASLMERDSWIYLLCRYYQHSAFIDQHHKKEELAMSYINKAVELANSLETEDVELIGLSLYKRSRLHLMQSRTDAAKTDIMAALKLTERIKGSLRGNVCLLAAEIHALYSQKDEKLKQQCRKWQDAAANLLYKGTVGDDGTFLKFNLYAVHHERAKMLARFSLFHIDDTELLTKLKDKHVRADSAIITEAYDALAAAKKHLNPTRHTEMMNYTLTEARVLLIEKELEESARLAKDALKFAQTSHSKQGIKEVTSIYTMLKALAPMDPYVYNLGVELGLY